jgi:hypothetical protein
MAIGYVNNAVEVVKSQKNNKRIYLEIYRHRAKRKNRLKAFGKTSLLI